MLTSSGDGQAPDSLPELINTLLTQAESSQAPLALIPLTGVAIDVTLQIGNVHAESPARIGAEMKVGSSFDFFSSERKIDKHDVRDVALCKAHILTLYNNVIVMSKTPVPHHTSVGQHLTYDWHSIDPPISDGSERVHLDVHHR